MNAKNYQAIGDLQDHYVRAANEFSSLQSLLLEGRLTGERFFRACELWNILEESDASARQHFSITIRYEGLSHLDRFDDDRARINLCLQDSSRAPSFDEEYSEDVTEVDQTGMCMDAGQADDWEGK